MKPLWSQVRILTSISRFLHCCSQLTASLGSGLSCFLKSHITTCLTGGYFSHATCTCGKLFGQFGGILHHLHTTCEVSTSSVWVPGLCGNARVLGNGFEALQLHHRQTVCRVGLQPSLIHVTDCHCQSTVLYSVFSFLETFGLMHRKCSVRVDKTGECAKKHTHTHAMKAIS